MKLTVKNPILLIDKRKGQSSAVTQITYIREDKDANIPLGLWYWRSDNLQNPIPAFAAWEPTIGIAQKSNENNTIFSVDVFPGETYIYRLAYLNNGQISDDGVEIEIVGLLLDGQSDFGIEGVQNVGTNTIPPLSFAGGTYINYQFQTKVPAKGVFCTMSHLPWKINPKTKMLYFTKPYKHYNLNNTLSQNHTIHLKPLYPGNLYYGIVLLMDEYGRWQFFTDISITKKRKLNIKIKNITFRGQILLEDTLSGTTFFHSISRNDGNSQQICTCFHTEKNITSLSDISVVNPHFFQFNPVWQPPVWPRNNLGFDQDFYTESESVSIYTQSVGDICADSDFKSGDLLFFTNGYSESDVVSQTCNASSPDDTVGYEVFFEHWSVYI
jgi:hypothetical protein